MAGCTSVSMSIQQRVTVSEECRDTLASVPARFGEHTNIASIFVGDVGRCDIVHDESLLPMCALAQVRTRFGVAPPLDLAVIAPRIRDVSDMAKTLQPTVIHLAPPQPESDLSRAIASYADAAAGIAAAADKHPTRQATQARVDALGTAILKLESALPPAPAQPGIRLALQELGQAVAKLKTAMIPVLGAPAVQARLDAFDAAVDDLRTSMTALATQVRQLDSAYQEILTTVRTDAKKVTGPLYARRTEAIAKANSQAVILKSALTGVHRAHEALHDAARDLSTALPQQAGFELAAWSTNLRMQLAQLEQLLSGDVTLVFNAGIRDEVLTHVARRSLELLHGALKPADAVINRLDDKAYGAVSIGYLALGPNLQEGVNGAYRKVASVYEKRYGDGAQSSLLGAWSEPTKAFVWELKRAACDNLTQGTRFSMLSELVDTMLIMQVGNKAPEPEAPAPQQDKHAAPIEQPLPDGRTIGSLPPAAPRLPLMRTRLILGDTDAAAGTTSEQETRKTKLAAKITPLSVYAVNEWMARQQLLTQKIAEAMASPAAARDGKADPFQNIESVDEGLVKQIADAATAKAIDDAARTDPSMLRATPDAVGTQIANSVNVVTAATAVSQASAVLKVNLSVSNVNTFSPNNYNYNAPTIVVPPAPANEAAASPCAAIDFGAIGATCIDSGGSAVLEFAPRHFDSDSCIPTDLEPTLSAIGSALKGYRTRAGISYWATVQGYASLPPARMANCKGRMADWAKDCKYVNALRDPFRIEGCGAKSADRNVALSAARAGVAAEALEREAQGAVVVDRVQARGTATAGSRGAGAPPAVDQTVVIRLTPRVGP